MISPQRRRERREELLSAPSASPRRIFLGAVGANLILALKVAREASR